MANRLSIDWPRGYYEALEKVADLPEYAGRLAVFPIAEAGQRFKAGSFRGASSANVGQDTTYRDLEGRNKVGDTIGYVPGVCVQLDVLVPEGNVGCVMIYNHDVLLSSVRARAQQLRVEHRGMPEVEESVPVSTDELAS